MAGIVAQVGTATAIKVQGEASFRTAYEFYGAPAPDGVTEKSLIIALSRNAVVNKFEVVISAAPAHAATAGAAGQVRTTAVNGGVSVVLDFGTQRTVSAVQAPSGVLIKSISTWNGTEFSAPPKYDSHGRDESGYVTLQSEVRCEKLQVIVSGSPTTQALATQMVLVLPESPAGIDLRIDTATPVFSQAPAVAPGGSAELSSQAWNSQGQRVVDLGPALAALTGNALDDSTVTFTARLTSRVPGVLDLQLRPGGQDVLHIRRATFNGQPAHDVAFDSEGRQSIALDSLPSNLTVREVRITASGTPPAVRVVPPLGPEPPDPVFADFSITPQRAACIRLPAEPRFTEVNQVRVPLAAGAAGGEARVLLWRSKNAVDDVSPSEALENGVSEPLTLAPGNDAWQTFAWKKAIPIPKDCVLWAVVSVNRGDAVLTLADVSAGEGAEPLLWGAPSGPWHDLPSGLASARGRIRVVGKPKPSPPFPLVHLALGAAEADVTPNAKGTPVVLSGSEPQTGPTTLVMTSYAPALVTLSDIDVISTS